MKWIVKGRGVLCDVLAVSAGWRVPVFSLALAISAVALAWPWLGGDTLYPEFVVGQHSWLAENKERDFSAFYLLALLALVLYLFVSGLYYALLKTNKSTQRALDGFFDILFLPLAPWLGLLFLGPNVWPPYAWYMAASGGLILLVVLLFRKSNADEAEGERILNLVVGCLVFGFFSGLSLTLCYDFFFFGMAQVWKPMRYGLLLGPPLVLAGAAAWLLIREPDALRLQNRLARALLWSQFLLPLLMFALLPPRLVQDGARWPYLWPKLLTVLIACYVVGAWWVLIRKGRRLRMEVPPYRAQTGLSVWCILGVVVFLSVGRPLAAFLWGDDFHMGDELVPWQQWIQFGKIPYDEFAPFHGFMHMLSGVLNQRFYGGDLAGHFYARKVMFAVAAGISFVAIYRLVGVRVALFCAVFFTPISFYMGRMVFLAPLFLLLADPVLMERARRWLLAWVATAFFLVLYNAVFGVAFGLASFPFAIWQAWRLWKSSPGDFGRLTGWLAGLAIGLVLVPLTRQLLFGYIGFMLENKLAYAACRGITWAAGFGHVAQADGPLSNAVIDELFRMAWIPACIGVGYLLLRTLGKRKGGESATNIYLFSGTTILLLGLTMYSLRRIDVGDLSRTGNVSYMALALLVPVSMARYLRPFRLAALWPIAALLGMYSLLLGFQDRLYAQGLFWHTFRTVNVPAHLKVIEPGESELAFLSGTVVEPERYEQMLAFKEALDEIVPDNQTYYDLTNRKLYYYVTNKPVPARYDAEASAVNSVQQSAVVKTLQEHPPPAVFAGPIWVSDHRSNLRSYHIFRHVALNYVPIERGPFTFLVNATSPAYPGPVSRAERMRILGALFSYYDLKAIPVAWGRSWRTLQHQARRVQRIDPGTITESSNGRVVTVDIAALGLSGQDADLLMVRLNADEKVGLEAVELSWRSEPDGLKQPVRFNPADGRQIVPLGSFPEWLLAEQIRTLTLRLPPGVHLSSLELWARTDGPATYEMGLVKSP